MIYTFTDHLHNYGIWTAARAVQRNFTNTRNIKAAIDQTELKGLIDNKDDMSIEQFDSFHRSTAHTIISFLKTREVHTSYGRAAKIIAIYIKTAVIIKDSGLSNISKIAHPPLDNILLTRLKRKMPELGINGIRWTLLDEINYFELINKLRTLNLDYFWELEKYWTPIQNEQ